MCISEAHTREPFIKHTHDLNSKARALRGNAQANVVITVCAELREKGHYLAFFNDMRTFKPPGFPYSSVPVRIEVELIYSYRICCYRTGKMVPKDKTMTGCSFS